MYSSCWIIGRSAEMVDAALHQKSPRRFTIPPGRLSNLRFAMRTFSKERMAIIWPEPVPGGSVLGDLVSAFSLAASAAIAGPSCAITASRLNEAAFWRGGYLT